MSEDDLKTIHQHYLQSSRDAMLWKLDGLSEYDARRPMTPTATNLLGLVKHLACVEYGYFGIAFARPPAEPFPWDDDRGDPAIDMWARADETRAEVLAFHARAVAHADATIAELDLDAPGSVPWWPEGGQDVTLGTVLVHVLAERQRHAGHADILRETIDGAAGLRASHDNLTAAPGAGFWSGLHARVEAAAGEAQRRAG